MPQYLQDLFVTHIATRQLTYEKILKQTKFAGVVIGAGDPMVYHADDLIAPFRATPHFTHWCPEQSPHHLLAIRPGEKPQLLFYSPPDFWHEQPSFAGTYWADSFGITVVADLEAAWGMLGRLDDFAYLGPVTDLIRGKGVECNPEALMASLDWERGLKSEFEIACLSGANVSGARGHRAARDCFAGGGSELEAHYEFVKATGIVECELPYPTIIGMDAKSAILHYRGKQRTGKHKVMLIDAGTRFENYCSDITRTYLRKGASQTFAALLSGMEQLQQSLCSLVEAGAKFLDLHRHTMEGISRLLLDTGVIRNCTQDFMKTNHIAELFFPHGLGHMLGIQVHDVGGKQVNADGEPAPISEEYPKLRTVRTLREGEVVTIEPGLYFIPLQLDPLRDSKISTHFNWQLIDELVPLGGIRIEDNVQVLAKDRRNLTREHLGNDYLI